MNTAKYEIHFPEARALELFTLFLGWKMASFQLAHALGGGWSHFQGIAFALAMMSAATLLIFPRTRTIGNLALLGMGLYRVVTLFPWTPNHYYLETLLLIALCFSSVSPRDQVVSRQVLRLVQVSILAAFFYGGLQKAAQGYWLSGEYLAHTMMYAPSWSMLGASLRLLLSGWAGATLPGPQDAFYASLGVEWVSHFAQGILSWGWIIRSLSWGIVLGEIALPLLMLLPETKRLALPALVALQIGVVVVTGIWSFGLLGCAALALFSPGSLERNYRILWIALFVLSAFGSAVSLGLNYPYTWF